MTEDALREVAATDAPSSVPGTHGVGSSEFFFLLQRIDRLDEKMSNQKTSMENRLTNRIESLDVRVTGDIKAVAADLKSLDDKITRKIDSMINALDNKIQNLDSNLTGENRAFDSKLTGEIRALGITLTGKIESEIKNLSDRLTNMQHWMAGLILTVFLVAGGIIIALLQHH